MMIKFLLVILFAATNQLVTATKGNVVYNPKSAIPGTHEESERKEVCMGELGCFDTGYPFNSPGTERILSLAPDPREDIGTEFRFFSPKNKDIAQYVTNTNFSSWNVKNSGFFRGWVTYFILHGFMGGNKEWPLSIKNALLNKENCNVIIVDWTNGHGPIYEQAVSNIRVVGAEVGLFIQRMMNVSNMYPEFVHIIGHSLGAHASGYAGKWFRDKEKKLVSRITGLDPAGPYFNGVDPAVRLDKGDADFVDVIHTNAAWTRFTGFGLEEPIGDVDFYPNGGEDQTGCSKAFEASAGAVAEFLSYFNVYSLIYKYINRGSLNPNVNFRAEEATERSEVCMDELGCFDRGYPFDSPRLQRFISTDPESREKIGTEFRFYSPVNQMIPQYITNLNFSSWDINDSGFNNTANTFFIIHDFRDGNAQWSEVLRYVILSKQESNVFVVDWSNGAGPRYEQAVANIRVVGAEIGLFIRNLKNSTKLNPLDTVHIVGHGLGAHAAGYAGKWIQKKAKSLVSRITGLDPSGPFFKGVDPAVRLDKDDATFVDVIHTNQPKNGITGFGIEEAIGDVDFYVNGGEFQPGCYRDLMVKNVNEDEFLSYTNIDVILDEYLHKGMVSKDVMMTVPQHVCSHRRACELFIASFDEKCRFEARHCKDADAYWMQECDSCRIEGCLKMGYDINRDIYKWEKAEDMEYYLTTKATWPYCFGK